MNYLSVTTTRKYLSAVVSSRMYIIGATDVFHLAYICGLTHLPLNIIVFCIKAIHFGCQSNFCSGRCNINTLQRGSDCDRRHVDYQNTIIELDLVVAVLVLFSVYGQGVEVSFLTLFAGNFDVDLVITIQAVVNQVLTVTVAGVIFRLPLLTTKTGFASGSS